MPILVNKETGLAERLDDNAAQQGVANGTHAIPLNDPQGNPVTADQSQAQELLSQGYSQPNAKNYESMLKAAKFGTDSESLKTAAEAGASAATFGISKKIESVLGAKKADIEGRAEENPKSALAGEVASLVAPTAAEGLLGKLGATKAAAVAGRLNPELSAMEKIGNAAAQGVTTKIGSTAAKFAAENAVFQAGSEADKKFMNDPHQSAQSVISDIGLAALVGGATGGAFGKASDLWSMGPGKQLSSLLDGLKNRSSGLPEDLKTAANIDLAPEVEGALGNTPKAKAAAEALMDSGSSKGELFRNKIAEFHDNVDRALPEILGKTDSDVNNIFNESTYDAGKTVQNTLSDALQERVAPISEQYNKFQDQFGKTLLSEQDKAAITDQVTNLIHDQGLGKGPNESALKLAQKTIEQMNLQETAQDLRKYVQNLNSVAPYGSENYQVAKGLRSILNDANEAAIGRSAAGSGTYEAFQQTQKEYGQFKGLLEELNDRLHLGREAKGGAGGFVKALKEMDPEKVVQRLGLKNDVGLQTLLSQQFPEVAEMARQQELNKLIKKSMDASGEGINAKKLFKNVDALSPELKQYAIGDEGLKRLEAIRELVNRAPTGINSSKTATALDKMWKHAPGAAGGMVGMLTGHNPVSGFLFGSIAHYVGREVPDAIRLATLKFIGSADHTSAEGFKAAIETAAAHLRTEKTIQKAATAILRGGAFPTLDNRIKQREKLDKQLTALAEKPEDAMDVGGHVGHYLPDHGSALAMAGMRAATYLASIKPNNAPQNPLDKELPADPVKEANYNRALDIANNPMLVMKAVHDGTLTQKDLTHLGAMYPELAKNMQSQLYQEMIEAVHDDRKIPYQTKMALSMFMGQPLEASLTQRSIAASQPIPVSLQQPGAVKAKPTATGLNHLTNLSSSYLTPGQSAQQRRTKAH